MYADPLLEAQETFQTLGWRYALSPLQDGKYDKYTVWNAEGELVAQDISESVFIGMSERV